MPHRCPQEFAARGSAEKLRKGKNVEAEVESAGMGTLMAGMAASVLSGGLQVGEAISEGDG